MLICNSLNRLRHRRKFIGKFHRRVIFIKVKEKFVRLFKYICKKGKEWLITFASSFSSTTTIKVRVDVICRRRFAYFYIPIVFNCFNFLFKIIKKILFRSYEKKFIYNVKTYLRLFSLHRSNNGYKRVEVQK